MLLMGGSVGKAYAFFSSSFFPPDFAVNDFVLLLTLDFYIILFFKIYIFFKTLAYQCFLAQAEIEDVYSVPADKKKKIKNKIIHLPPLKNIKAIWKTALSL